MQCNEMSSESLKKLKNMNTQNNFSAVWRRSSYSSPDLVLMAALNVSQLLQLKVCIVNTVSSLYIFEQL